MKLKYKGYTAKINYDESTDMYFGTVETNDDAPITFEGFSKYDLEQEFHNAVNDYLCL